jgi:hypothetical protein
MLGYSLVNKTQSRTPQRVSLYATDSYLWYIIVFTQLGSNLTYRAGDLVFSRDECADMFSGIADVVVSHLLYVYYTLFEAGT